MNTVRTLWTTYGHSKSAVCDPLMNLIDYRVMSQSIPTVYIPRAKPWKIFFERANPGHQGAIVLSNSLLWGKNDGRIPGGGTKPLRTRRNCSLSLQKPLKIKKTTRQYKFFIWRT